MFYTDDHIRIYEALGCKASYSRLYYEILKPNDEFGYLTLANFSASFDSKQNFDTNYKGNWFFYYK